MRRFWYVPAAIILALIVAAFLGGWLQLALPPDTFGVIYTRNHGFDPLVVRHDGFTWRWQRLLPKMLVLHRFTLAPRLAELPISGSLASGEVYASLVPERPDFSYELHVAIRYRVRPDSLPRLAEKDGLRPEGLQDWYRTADADLVRRATETALASEAADAPGVAADLVARLPDRVPELELLDVAPTVIRMPDRELYTRLRTVYLSSLAAREPALVAAAGRLAVLEAEARIDERKHDRSIAVLDRYGKLLDEHPGLIQFLFLTTSGKLTTDDLRNLDLLDHLAPLE
ncbi:MAG: hypothetical protein A2177_04805 [Spirochaetes bacterium RBG_13_68_11]|nr:MAG: hypothetical protein A2177_04805 [Spirochaetes bacterium RBG_13_68_11]